MSDPGSRRRPTARSFRADSRSFVLLAVGVAVWVTVPRARAASPGPHAPHAVTESEPYGMWSEEGHAIVCEIAWRELTAKARRQAEALLSLDPEYDRFAPACAWADIVRRAGGYDVYTPAHYVNLPRGAARFDPRRDCAERLCVVEAIEIFASRLRDPTLSPEAHLEALKFLGHFVGDVHQPLHVGYADDRGGNDVRACTAERDSTNLHSVWDRFILGTRLAASGLDRRAYAARLHSEIRPVERRLWAALEPATWAEESFAIVESQVYDGAGAGCFTAAYATAHGYTVERRVKQAGYRLGALLNRLLG